jgi:hypothetical protein
MDEDDKPAARVQLAVLKQEHEDLDASIIALEGSLAADQLRIARLKKRKLALRDQITELGNQLTPDIIA